MGLLPVLLALPPPPPALPARAFDYPSSLDSPSSSQLPPAPPLSSLTRGDGGERVTACARRCVPGCIRGGAGGPGLGPLTLRKDPVVFDPGFRSREYCLSECVRVCKAITAAEPQK